MSRKIVLVSNQVDLHHNHSEDDLNFWLSKEPQERLAAVTFLVRQNLQPNQRMDKSYTAQRKMKYDT